MRAHDYTTLFKTEHMLKDVRLCLEEAQAAGCRRSRRPRRPRCPARRPSRRGHGADDFAALLEAYEGFAGPSLCRPQRYRAICSERFGDLGRIWENAGSPVARIARSTARSRAGSVSVACSKFLLLNMPIAFKEWAVTVRALAEGEQLLTLRKGGIREPEQALRARARPLLPLPDIRPPAQRLVRASHQPELRRALEEGVWAEGEPPPNALLRDGGIAQPDRVRIRAWAEVAEHWTIDDPRTRRRAVAVLRLDPRLRREAAGLEAPPPAARAAAAHLPDPAPGHRQGARRVRRLPSASSSSTATCPSRARRCSRDDEFDRASEEIRAIVEGGVPALV